MNVYNKKHNNAPAGAVYIGRPTIWGNPYTHKTGTLATHIVNTAEEAVAMYKQWLLSNPALVAKAKQELKGKDLVCWCKPGPCHGDVLLEIANQT